MRFFVLILCIAVLAFAGGFVFFAVWDVPHPPKQVVHKIPNEQFFQVTDHGTP